MWHQRNDLVIIQNVSEVTARAEKFDQLNFFHCSCHSLAKIDRTLQLSQSLDDHSVVMQTTQQLWTFAFRHVHRGDKGPAAAFLRTDLHPVARPVLCGDNIKTGLLSH